MDLEAVDLIVDEESFMCVARRLLKKNTKNYEIKSEILSKWLEKCGGDLVVFAISFDPSRPEKLNRSTIAAQVRRRYIIPAEKQGCKDLFLALCTLSVIDLNMEDQAIWNGSAESLFPEFIENGIVIRTTKKEGNPRLYCQMFHPSLGALILSMLANFDNFLYEKIWLEYAIKACQQAPIIFTYIHSRLMTGNYMNVVDLQKWCTAIECIDGLVERALCHLPSITSGALKKKKN